MCCIRYEGKDVDSSTIEELIAVANRKQDACNLMNSGWCTFHDVCRRESDEYMKYTELEDFPDEASRIIEAERRDRASAKGTTYENEYVLTICWMPEGVKMGKAREMLYSTDGLDDTASQADQNVHFFKNAVANIVDRLSYDLAMELLGNYDVEVDGHMQTNNAVLEHLFYCISGTSIQIALPESTMYMDSFLGIDFVPGVIPVIGEMYISTVVVDGFPLESFPQLLSGLDALPFEYRWSNRFIYLDEHEAIAEVNKYRRKWSQKERGFKDQVAQSSEGLSLIHI